MADSPVVQIAISGANTVVPSNMTKVSTTQYTFTYTVGAGDGTATVSLSTGTDLAGNGITSTPTSGATFTVDNTAPAISSVTGPANGRYRAGQTLNFTVNYSENVTVAGTAPTIGLTIGATARSATYVSGSGNNTLLFSYTVQSGDNDADGIAMASSITLPGGTTLRDAAGNNAGLTFTAPDTSSVLVDTIAPTAAITYSPTGPVKQGTSLTITATFSEPMADSPVVKGQLGIAADADRGWACAGRPGWRAAVCRVGCVGQPAPASPAGPGFAGSSGRGSRGARG